MTRLFRWPLAWVGGALALLWLFYVGVALRPRFALPPLDTSRPVLLSRGSSTTLVQTAPDGQAQPTEKTIGPVTPWKNGLVYWDNAKPCLVYAASGQKPQLIWLHPSFPKLSVASVMPAPDGVYLNMDSASRFSVLYVHLPSGVGQIIHGAEEVKSGETVPTYASRTTKNNKAAITVHYTNHTTRRVLVGDIREALWDYDPVRDAVVWVENDTICCSRPARSWRKPFAGAYAVAVNQATGDVWLQTSGGFGGRGMVVLAEADGTERGWRWHGETIYADALWELSREQEKLFRALPSHKFP